ncbi:hypothetical protein IID23_00820 [Patescibacteria group bacterium]|nr:hypothetical protein [Patescibacteria group bacterium]
MRFYIKIGWLIFTIGLLGFPVYLRLLSSDAADKNMLLVFFPVFLAIFLLLTFLEKNQPKLKFLLLVLSIVYLLLVGLMSFGSGLSPDPGDSRAFMITLIGALLYIPSTLVKPT